LSRCGSETKEELYRRNIVSYPNQQELLQIKHEQDSADKEKRAQKPVTQAGFTSKDFKRVAQSLRVLHENKVTYNYLKLMLS